MLFALLTCGCSAFTSGVYLSEGRHALINGDYEAARNALEKTVELYPDGQGRLDLAYAYERLGEDNKCWIQLRKVCLSRHKNLKACEGFNTYWNQYQKKYQIIQGVQREKIIECLGEPDCYIVKNDEEECLIYGLVTITLKDNKLEQTELSKL